jgi:hypothetical protein
VLTADEARRIAIKPPLLGIEVPETLLATADELIK